MNTVQHFSANDFSINYFLLITSLRKQPTFLDATAGFLAK